MDSVHKNFYLAPDLKKMIKIKPKKVANDQKINLALYYKLPYLKLHKKLVFQDFCGANKEWRLEYDSTSGWTCGEMLSFGAPDLPGEQV